MFRSCLVEVKLQILRERADEELICGCLVGVELQILRERTDEELVCCFKLRIRKVMIMIIFVLLSGYKFLVK